MPAPRRLLPCFLTVLAALIHSPVSAQNEPIDWGNPSTLDTVDPVLSGSNGEAVHWLLDRNWVFYTKGENLWVIAHTENGWETPSQLTFPPARVRNPHVHGTQVVWEDLRGLVPEIWTARFDGVTWSGEQILSPNDGIPSLQGVIASSASGYLAAWEDSTASGFRVYMRRNASGSWLPPEPVTANTVGQRDPSVSGMTGLIIDWADFRHGEPEIYSRTFYNGAWNAETRLTDLPGACRHPSVVLERSGDLSEYPHLAFESVAGTGAIETYVRSGGGSPTRISPDDGIPSVRPNSSTFAGFQFACGLLPGYSSAFYVTWTDTPPDGPRSHFVWGRSGIDATPGDGIATSLVGAEASGARAYLAEVWVELAGGIPVLRGRAGTTVGCFEVGIEAAPSLILGPEGVPETLFRTVNSCGGAPAGGVYLEAQLDESLVEPLTWDPAYPLPYYFGVVSDEDGQGRIPLYGGGCDPDGTGRLECLLWGRHDWLGAKSPDVNGDCIVGPDDLDMSGTVGPEDVTIVEMTLGDHCSYVTGIPGTGSEAGPGEAGEFIAAPNPATEFVRFRTPDASQGEGAISIYDAAGRRIRTLEPGPDGSQVSWNLRDASGVRVADGIYFAAFRAGETKQARTILVLRAR